MALKKTVARNVVWNWAGVVISMIAGFVVAPFLVRRLGETTYGIWILLASLTGYFGLLDLGVRGSVGRYVAFHRAKNDQEGVNTILSTALAILSGVALLGMLFTGVVLVIFFYLFDVPANQVATTRIALVIVGLNLALMLPLDIFNGTLWGFQRFDILNAIDIVMVAIRTALTLWLIGQGYGLVSLAFITLFWTLGGAAAKAAMCFRLNPELRLGPRHVKKWAVRCLYGYGIWNFLLSMARMALPKLNPVIIGSRLGLAMVTPFAITTRLMEYATSILIASAGVLTPVATAFHAEEKHDQQQRLFLLGGRYCLALALFFCTLFLCLGKSFLVLWMGPSFESSYLLLAILAIGEVLPLSQMATTSLILGTGRHKSLALMSLIEDVVAIGLALALMGPLGLPGVCLGVVLPGAVFRGIGPLVYGCGLVKMPVWQYARRSLLPPLAAALIPGLGLALLVHWRPPAGWPGLVLETALFGISYGIFASLIVIGYDRLRRPVVQFTSSWLWTKSTPEPVCR
jgi:O-antigen/teichoic acid export membrane protein